MTAETADLVVSLGDLDMYEADGVRRPRARVRLTFRPPGRESGVEGEPFRLIAPIGPIEADELRWYLERWAIWPSVHLRDRARRIESQMADWGRKLWHCFDAGTPRSPIEAWKRAAGTSRQLTVHVDDRLSDDRTDTARADAAEAATKWLALPWELIHDDTGYLLQGQDGIHVRRRRAEEKKVFDPEPTEAPIRVLLVSPRPDDRGYFDHRVSAKPLVEALQGLAVVRRMDGLHRRRRAGPLVQPSVL